jgi:hypothetical protein
VSRLSDVENVETVEGAESNSERVREKGSHSFRDAEIPGSLNGIVESKKSAESGDVIDDKNREWTDGPKQQES